MTNIADIIRTITNEPPGYARLREFCGQVEAGQVPDGELLQELAAAFRAMLAEDGLEKQRRAFTKAMQMHRRKGLNQPTAAEQATN